MSITEDDVKLSDEESTTRRFNGATGAAAGMVAEAQGMTAPAAGPGIKGAAGKMTNDQAPMTKGPAARTKDQLPMTFLGAAFVLLSGKVSLRRKGVEAV